MSENAEILIEATGVSKKFCRNMKRSLWYGMKDVTNAMLRINSDHSKLREEEFWAVRDINFSLRRGECLGLIGRNGAGKSTLLKMLNGLIRPDEGSITMRGKVGALIELGAGFNPILTGRENIYVNGQLLGFTQKELDKKLDAILSFAEIGEFIDSPIQNYSSGMKVRLGFAVAAQMEPDILIIDEVLAVGDIGFRIKCMNRISEMLKNSAVIFVSHSMQQVARICTGGLLMERGQVQISTNDIGKLIENYYLRFESEGATVFGSGKATITEFKLSNYTSKHDDVFVYTGNIVADIKIKVDPSIKKIGTHFIIIDSETRPVAIASSFNQDQVFDNNTGEIHITANITNVLASGHYSVHFTIVDVLDDNRSVETLASYRGVAKFIVTNSTKYITPPVSVLAPAAWKVNA